MVTKITCGKTQICADKFHVESAPGVGNVVITEFAEPIWTGDVHLWPSKGSAISLHIGNIISVETRSNMDESDECWQTECRRVVGMPFSYEYEWALTEILEKLSKL